MCQCERLDESGSVGLDIVGVRGLTSARNVNGVPSVSLYAFDHPYLLLLRLEDGALLYVKLKVCCDGYGLVTRWYGTEISDALEL